MNNPTNISTSGANIINSIWHHNILTIAQNSITLGNLIIAGVFLFIGLKYYKSFTGWVNTKLIKKLEVDKDTLNILENLIFYSLFTLFIILILQLANIPLSIFAFIGGAFAISLGLGAQTFINNFICSLIVMIERPLKIGDMVQLSSVFGTVKSIGIRNTIIISPSDVEVVIPNTMIINNILVNWTLNDCKIKYRVLFKTSKYPKHQYTQVNETIKKLLLIVADLSFILDKSDNRVSLITVDKKSYSYLIEFYFEAKTINDFKEVKNALNLKLVKEFDGVPFSIEYTKDMELKTPNI